MKHFFTLFLLGLFSLGVSATDFTDNLKVTVNGTSTEQKAVVSVSSDNNVYTLSLKNFVLSLGGQQMGIGNITIADLQGEQRDGYTLLRGKQNIRITAGDDSSVGMWMGPMLGEVPVDVKAKVTDSTAYAVINITMSALQQNIQVTFGSGYQIANSGFEYWHTATISDLNGDNTTTSDEPNTWHSFMSATGSQPWVYFAGNTPHVFKSNVTRPGSTGKLSAMVTSTQIWTIVANGTITTGRLAAGSMDPSDVANHSQLDFSDKATDGNGDPFYVKMYGRPDSLALWVKFIQGTPNATYPYATVSAAITDGTYYQDPQGTTQYKNVLATAKNAEIVSNGAQWQRIVVPFDYIGAGVDGKGLLVTVSTNATAGKGSVDTLYVDDVELIYNTTLKSLSVKGSSVKDFSAWKQDYEVSVAGKLSASDIAAVASSSRALVDTQVKDEEGGQVATVTVTSEDLRTSTVYTIHAKSTATGIHSVKTVNSDGAVYDLQGRRLMGTPAHGVYIRGGKKFVVK